MTPLSLNVAVRQHGFDPLIIGVVIGVVAAVLGFLIGLYVITLM